VRLAEGDDVTVIAIGSLISRALDAAARLRAEGIGVRVLNMPFVDPIDIGAVLAAARETRGIVTAEEATISGGLGAAVAAAVVTAHPVPMRILGIPRVFAPTGNTAFLLDHFGLSADGIVTAVRDLLGRDHG
jgi:transketolase